MKIIPAIDIMDGKCVRLQKGDFATQKKYNDSPLEVARQFQDHGIKYLHLVDLDGAKSSHIINYNILESISSKTTLKVDFGGGLKSHRDIRIAFESGAGKITGGSVAVENPEMFLSWLLQYGADKIMLGADCIHRKIASHGWLKNWDIDVVDFVEDYAKKGIQTVVCTDISKDGMLQGSANLLYAEILSRVKVDLIASGGVSSIQDLEQLKLIGCSGAIVGKAIYEGKISLKELQNYVEKENNSLPGY